ncbi:secreted phosphoprotein 24-like isoform X2 [Pristis pectinata]|uniref:secreted phosphoprotein 24-like isoform X2 n=1 Tax=Pristis pectinata TaxID=685728 RepID=UPI00223D9E7B|nr:secreted phosphoprotein 24-like isoform X2 [Pristis pectinata]
MKIILFILSSLQILCCSGQPCGNCTFPVIDEALIASVRKLNDISSIDNLFAMVKGEVKDIVSVGERMFFVDLALDVQETVCPKDSGLDWADCALKPLATAETANCTSRVTFDIDVVVNVEVQCTEMDWITPKPRPIPDSESSSESNESSDESSSEDGCNNRRRNMLRKRGKDKRNGKNGNCRKGKKRFNLRKLKSG